MTMNFKDQMALIRIQTKSWQTKYNSNIKYIVTTLTNMINL